VRFSDRQELSMKIRVMAAAILTGVALMMGAGSASAQGDPISALAGNLPVVGSLLGGGMQPAVSRGTGAVHAN
jgi:hypothetical protein